MLALSHCTKRPTASLSASRQRSVPILWSVRKKRFTSMQNLRVPTNAAGEDAHTIKSVEDEWTNYLDFSRDYESKVDHTALIIELLSRAYEQFKVERQSCRK